MRYRQNREIAYRAIEGEAVLFDTARGMMRQLNPLGTELWELLTTDRTLDELVTWVLERYQGDERSVRRDVGTFVGALLERNLVIATNETPRVPRGVE